MPTSTRAVRLLNAAAATLAAGAVTDSTAEHYRAGFHNRAMFVAPAVSAAALASAITAISAPNSNAAFRQAVFATSIVTGLFGSGFHVKNVSQRVGGWNSVNIFRGAPLAAPFAVTMAGLLGLLAARVARDPSTAGAVTIGAVSALGLLGTSAEATALHFRGAFQNPIMYAPVVLPPVAGAVLATASLTRSSHAHSAAPTLLRLTAWLGIAGVGFHAWGIHRRMGGWRNWRQNLLVGPPLPAPPAFTGLALAGLAALHLQNNDSAQ